MDSGLGLSGVWMKDLLPGAPTPVERMRNAREQHKRNRRRAEKVFASLDEAIEANAKNEVFPKALTTARNIVQRHIRPHPSGGYTFIHDTRTYGQSQYVCLTEEQTRAFLKEIRCPLLRIHAKPEFSKTPENLKAHYAERYKCIQSKVTNVVVLGDHHVHSDNAPAVARAICVWFEEGDPFVHSHLNNLATRAARSKL
jgi:hypothetical protein